MPRPFDGVRILDLTHVLAGPFATYQLAVLGADVIKIEPPDRPDFVRFKGPDPALNRQQRGVNYQVQGGSKRAMALDLKTPGGRRVFRRMVRTADVVVENYRAGALEELGLGPGQLARLNPRLIHCSMTGYGQGGPRAGVTAYDNVIQAASGIIDRCGGHKPNLPFVDYASGYNAAFAIAAALYGRDRDGRGQRIDCSMLDTALMLMGPHLAAQLHAPDWQAPPEAGLGAYPTADGVFVLGAPTPDQNRRLWTALASEGHDHPRFRDLPDFESLHRHSQAMRQVLAGIFLSRTAAAWEDWVHAHGLPGERLRTLAEITADDQLRHRPLLHHGANGDPTVPVAAFAYAHDGPERVRPAPAVGEHTQEILEEIGFTTAEVEALKAEGAVR
ncbi:MULTISPECIES: CoA transferase [unclassified Streptomyces]|uniref:CaiB/BaiF CoA transferase family protein n=1 Tax=unclassified Streptomyces TaxID=2593676 RepID=UPI0003605BEB|nr:MULTISPECIES: CoA transferase [unclassified Streptomyces]MYT32633.1 CoA transferase [Streptomyces sp. SID8354]